MRSLGLVFTLAATASAFSPSVLFSKPQLQGISSTKYGSSVFSSRPMHLRTENMKQVKIIAAVARLTDLQYPSLKILLVLSFVDDLWHRNLQCFVPASKFDTALSATTGIDFPVVNRKISFEVL